MGFAVFTMLIGAAVTWALSLARTAAAAGGVNLGLGGAPPPAGLPTKQDKAAWPELAEALLSVLALTRNSAQSPQGQAAVRAYQEAGKKPAVTVALRTDEQGLFCDWEKLNDADFHIYFASGHNFQSGVAEGATGAAGAEGLEATGSDAGAVFDQPETTESTSAWIFARAGESFPSEGAATACAAAASACWSAGSFEAFSCAFATTAPTRLAVAAGTPACASAFSTAAPGCAIAARISRCSGAPCFA